MAESIFDPAGEGDGEMTWLSEMEYPHWLMVAGTWLVVAGFLGLGFSWYMKRAPAEDNLHPEAPSNSSVEEEESARGSSAGLWKPADDDQLREMAATGKSPTRNSIEPGKIMAVKKNADSHVWLMELIYWFRKPPRIYVLIILILAAGLYFSLSTKSPVATVSPLPAPQPVARSTPCDGILSEPIQLTTQPRSITEAPDCIMKFDVLSGTIRFEGPGGFLDYGISGLLRQTTLPAGWKAISIRSIDGLAVIRKRLCPLDNPQCS